MLFKIKNPPPKPQHFFNSKAYKKSAVIINPLTGKPFSTRTVENEGSAFKLAKASTLAMVWDREELQKLYDQSPRALAMLLVETGFSTGIEIEEVRFYNSHGREQVLMLQECDTTKADALGVPVRG
jgi:hypothetical protein